MTDGQRTGRPAASRNVRVTPEFREQPDIEKLGRALIAVAKSIAAKKMAEEQALNDNPFNEDTKESSNGGKGDGVP